VADGREVETDERFKVRKIGSVKIDVIESNPDSDGYECCREEKPADLRHRVRA